MQLKKAVLVVALALLAGCGADPGSGVAASSGNATPTPFRASDISSVNYQTDFELEDHDGRPRHLDDFKGRVALVFFGYANCPDVCPTTLARMGQAVKQLGPEGGQVQGLFITLDPRRDTPEALKKYVTQFHPAFLGLRGDEDAIKRLTKSYHVHMKSHRESSHGEGHDAHPPENYMVEHTGAVFAFDRQGELRLLFRGNDWTPDDMAHDLKLLLKP